MTRTKMQPIVSWAPRDRHPTFCGLDREDYEAVHIALTGKEMDQPTRDAMWRDRQAFRARLKRMLSSTGTMETQ